MSKWVKGLFTCLLLISDILPQGFNLPAKGTENFYFKNDVGRNQASFLSEARYENINGLTNDVWGQVSFDAKDLKNTLSGEVHISAASLKTGIQKRDEYLQSVSWLNAEKYPEIKFVIKDIQNVVFDENNLAKVSLMGEFTMHGRTKLIYASANIKNQEENEITKSIMPGDLITVSGKMEIFLSDFGISNSMIGSRVSNKIEITIFLIGSKNN